MKKLLILSFILSFIASLKGFTVSFVFIIIVFLLSLISFFYHLIKNKIIKGKIMLLVFISMLGILCGTGFLFFFTKYNAKLVVEKIDDYHNKYNEYPNKIEILSNKKNVRYHLVKNGNKEYYFLYYYVNGEYYHQYDGIRKLWFYTR